MVIVQSPYAYQSILSISHHSTMICSPCSLSIGLFENLFVVRVCDALSLPLKYIIINDWGMILLCFVCLFVRLCMCACDVRICSAFVVWWATRRLVSVFHFVSFNYFAFIRFSLQFRCKRSTNEPITLSTLTFLFFSITCHTTCVLFNRRIHIQRDKSELQNAWALRGTGFEPM